MIKKFTFMTNMYPNHLTCHALLSTILDKKQENNELLNYKIYVRDNTIVLIIEEDEIKELKKIYKFNHNGSQISIKLFGKESPCMSHFVQGEFVSLQGIISYAIHCKDKDICPITPYGNFAPNTRQHFYDYITKKTGIDFLTRDSKSEYFDSRFEWINYKSFNNQLRKEGDISFQNIFSMSITGYVRDEKKLNNLALCSIGRRRSYGFGNISVSKVES